MTVPVEVKFPEQLTIDDRTEHRLTVDASELVRVFIADTGLIAYIPASYVYRKEPGASEEEGRKSESKARTPVRR